MEDCISLFSFSIAGFNLWKKNLHSVQLLFKASIGLCNFKKIKKKKNLPEYRLET